MRDGLPITSGAASSTLAVTQKGVYQAQAAQSGCVIRSQAVTVQASTIATIPGADYITDSLPAAGSNRGNRGRVQAVGRIEKKALSLNRLSDGLFPLDLPVHDLPPGLYGLRLTDGPRQRSLRFIRR